MLHKLRGRNNFVVTRIIPNCNGAGLSRFQGGFVGNVYAISSSKMSRIIVTLMMVLSVAVASGGTFYDLLEIDQSATQKDIKRAFRKMALKYHPDKAEDKELAQQQFVILVEAFETLSDPVQRRNYDQNPRPHANASPANDDGSQESTPQQQQQYNEAQEKYNKFFTDLQRSFDDYIRKMEDNNWADAGDGEDSSFEFDFDDIWEGADDEELAEFSSLYKVHLKTHYTAHEKAVREVGCEFTGICV